MRAAPFSSISLFTGAGGLDIGLEQAGFRTITAVDSEPDCIRSVRENQHAGPYFNQTAVLLSEVERIEPAELRPDPAPPGWVPDLLTGGPPCQPFSSSGKMLSVGDPRGRLFEHFVRLAAGLKPKLILFENVRGIVTARGPKGDPGEVLHLVKSEFERIGYATNFTLLNAADYGCPQRRVRCFMVATRCTGLPEFPEPTHSERPGGGLFAVEKPWVTLGEFLATRPAPSPEEIVRPTPNLQCQLRDIAPGSGLKSAGAREATRPGGHWGYRQGTFIADSACPARTVTGSASQDWIRLQDGSLRRLTLQECAGLQGFPTGWRFVGSQASRFKQVGNAVPTIFGRVIGRALIAALRGGESPKPASAPLPEVMRSAIRYTQREEARNGESRTAVRKKLQAPSMDIRVVKGLGSAELPS